MTDSPSALAAAVERLTWFANACAKPRNADDERFSDYLNGEDDDVATDIRRVLNHVAAPILRPSTGIFDPALVLLECGHETYSHGAYAARCTACAQEDAKRAEGK